jgi:hypothetical protein
LNIDFHLRQLLSYNDLINSIELVIERRYIFCMTSDVSKTFRLPEEDAECLEEMCRRYAIPQSWALRAGVMMACYFGNVLLPGANFMVAFETVRRVLRDGDSEFSVLNSERFAAELEAAYAAVPGMVAELRKHKQPSDVELKAA